MTTRMRKTEANDSLELGQWLIRNFPVRLRREFSAQCVLKGKTIGVALAELVRDHLKKK